MCHSKKKDICKYQEYDVNWFKEKMLNQFDMGIESNDVGYESVLLEHGEIDENVISSGDLQSLPNPLQAHTFMYVESSGDEWLYIVVTDEMHRSILYETWFKNNQKIK